MRSIIQAQAMPDGRGTDESTIFVAGLPSDMTNLEMYQLFSAFGAIAPRGAEENGFSSSGFSGATALQDKETGKSTGSLNDSAYISSARHWICELHRS